MIKAIIFDLGGVVVGSFGEPFIKNASEKLNIKPSRLRELINKYEPDLQKGKIDHIQFWKKIIKEEGKDISEFKLSKLWITPYKKHAKIDRKMMSQIKTLRENYIVGCISNCQEPHNSYNKRRGLFDYFEPCILSSEVGMRKPDEKIFRLFIKEAKVKANECIFIDDEEKMLENAKKIGIKTIRFKNSQQLNNELNTYRLVLQKTFQL